MIIFLVLNFLGIVYFIYKIIIFRIGSQYTTGKYRDIGTVMLFQTGGPFIASCKIYHDSDSSVLPIAIYCEIAYIATFIVSLLVFFNFGKGLKAHRESPSLAVVFGSLTFLCPIVNNDNPPDFRRPPSSAAVQGSSADLNQNRRSMKMVDDD